MTSIEEFIRARLREDEAAARAACAEESPRWLEHCEGGLVRPDTYEMYNGRSEWVADCLSDAGPHIARHDPARVLREVKAKYLILEKCAEIEDSCEDSSWWYSIRAEGIVEALASAWSDHDDYDPRWAL